MRLLKAITFLLAVVFSLNIAQAQNLSKAEKKKLKKELKQYKKDPSSYKKMKTKTKEEMDQRDVTIAELTKQLDQQNVELRALRDSFASLNRRFNNLMEAGSMDIPRGTVYAVQIGYFELLKLDEFNKRIRTIRAENQGGGKRYVIGYFTDLNDAMEFGDEIKTIGIDDAFVSQYVNGVRNMKFDAQKAK
ncbi:MAG: hypothetical protein JJ975_03000 [Bacteroidia bacterium]|nr:hypothetical protein [Bacteroidia bacterium]